MHTAAFVLALFAFVQVGPGAASPFVGSWTANLSKSKPAPEFKVQSVTLQIAVAGDTLTMATEIVSASGQKQRLAETFRTDGTETPGTLNPGVVLMAKWLGTHVLACLAKKNDQVIALITYEVSSDGKMLTARSSGMIDQMIVFERE